MEVIWLAVIVAAVVKFVIGGVWYAPPVLGTTWQGLVRLTPEEMRAGLAPAMVAQIVGDLVMAYVLARLIIHYGAPSIANGALVGFMAWIGFVATVSLGQVFYERKPFMLWVINNGYQLIGIVAMGAILGWWHGGPAPEVTPA
jgi:hypothetical protein